MATLAGRRERSRKDAPKRSAAPSQKLSEEEIRLLAYYLYERRCASGEAGDAAGDWILAEHVLSNAAQGANTNGN
jgi:hypothetical protein